MRFPPRFKHLFERACRRRGDSGGAETQIVTFPLNRGRDVFVFATAPQASWTEGSWATPGDVEELRAMYADFHTEERGLLAAVDDVLKSALYVHDPLSCWSTGRTPLL